MNDSNFFVLEAGRGKDVLERSLEIAEVLHGVEGGDGGRKLVHTYFGKRVTGTVTSQIMHSWTANSDGLNS